jgi:hypothetical protein
MASDAFKSKRWIFGSKTANTCTLVVILHVLTKCKKCLEFLIVPYEIVYYNTWELIGYEGRDYVSSCDQRTFFSEYISLFL